MSDAIDGPRSGQGEDTTQGNWLTRNLWILKGFAAAGILVGLAFASLVVFDHEMANVLWAISITLAALVALLPILFAGVQAAQPT